MVLTALPGAEGLDGLSPESPGLVSLHVTHSPTDYHGPKPQITMQFYFLM